MFKTIIIVLACVFAFFILFCLYHLLYYIFVGRKKDKIKKINRERAKAEYEELKKQKRIEYAEYKNTLCKKYGEPDKVIRYGDIDNEIIVFAKSSIIVIRGEEYSFDDIISCSLFDDVKVKSGDTSTTIETKTNTGSLIGRSVAGGLIGGPIGAVIGASTASTTSSATSINDYEEKTHHYSLVIGVRRFECPTLRIIIGKQRSLALEIEAIFSIILSRDNKNN